MILPGFTSQLDSGCWRVEVTTPPVFSQVGTSTNGSTTVTVSSYTYTPIVGQAVSGTGIPANTVVATVGVSSFVMSAAATTNGAAATLTIGGEPVTVAEAKAFARVTHPDEDALIGDIISGVREYVEGPELKRAIMLQGRTLYLPYFPGGEVIQLPYPPFQGLISIKYIDNDGDLTTASLANVTQSLTPATPGYIAPAWGAVWPVPRSQIDAIQIEYKCGYGGLASKVPMSLKIGMRGMIAMNYENREEWIETKDLIINGAIERSLQTERWGSYS